MRRFTLCDFQYIHFKLRHYRCYHDVEKKAIEMCGSYQEKVQNAKSVKRKGLGSPDSVHDFLT